MDIKNERETEYKIYTENRYIKKIEKRKIYILKPKKKEKIINIEREDNECKCVVITNLEDIYEINNIYPMIKQMIIKNSEYLMIIKNIPENINEILVVKDEMNIMYEEWQKYKYYYYMIENIERYDENMLEKIIRIINGEGGKKILKIIILRKNYKIFYKIIDRINREKIDDILFELLEKNIIINNYNYDDNVYYKLSLKYDEERLYKKYKEKNIFHILAKNNNNKILFKKLYKRCKNKGIINDKDGKGLTVVHYILLYNNIEIYNIVKREITKETINMIDENNNNILYYYNNSNEEIIEEIIEVMDDKVFNKINNRRENILYKLIEYNMNIYQRINNKMKSKNLINKLIEKTSNENMMYKDEYENTIMTCIIKNKYYENIPNIINKYDEYYLNIINLIEMILQDYINESENKIYKMAYNVLLKKTSLQNLKNCYRYVFRTNDEEIIINYITEIKSREKNNNYLSIINNYIYELLKNNNLDNNVNNNIIEIFQKCYNL
jgi:hypothetical protein